MGGGIDLCWFDERIGTRSFNFRIVPMFCCASNIMYNIGIILICLWSLLMSINISRCSHMLLGGDTCIVIALQYMCNVSEWIVYI